MISSGKINPVANIKRLHGSGQGIDVLLGARNNYFAVAKYGSKTVVATINGNDVDFMNEQEFHKMFSNVSVSIEIKKSDGGTTKRPTKLSRYWYDWDGRRQFLGRGGVFEPGGPLQVQGDMLNIWRGFGVEPQQGDWSERRVLGKSRAF
jgi:hypothetical protein